MFKLFSHSNIFLIFLLGHIDDVMYAGNSISINLQFSTCTSSFSPHCSPYLPFQHLFTQSLHFIFGLPRLLLPPPRYALFPKLSSTHFQNIPHSSLRDRSSLHSIFIFLLAIFILVYKSTHYATTLYMLSTETAILTFVHEVNDNF